MKMYKMEDGSYINLERIEKLEIQEQIYEDGLGRGRRRSYIVAIFYAGETYNDTIIDSTILHRTDSYITNGSDYKEMKIKYEEARAELAVWLDNFVKKYMSEKK